MLNCHDEKAGFEGFFQLLSEFQQPDKSLDEDGEKVIKSYLVKDGMVG